MSGITLQDLYDLPGTEPVARHELYKAALADTNAKTEAGRVQITGGNGAPFELHEGMNPAQAAEMFDRLEKSVSADQAAQLSQDLAALKGAVMPDIQKDWTLTNPVSTGLVPYDLEAPAKFLVPRRTPLRNTIPRVKGQGTARQYKRITAVTNSGQSVAASSIFFDSTTASTTFNGLALNRPGKINYAGDDQTRKYVELGVSDLVGWKAQFAGLGFDDLRSLSQTALLYAHMMGEERADLFGRGTAAGGAGYLGSVSAPVISASNAGTGGTIPADTYHCYVVALNGMGQSLASAVSSTTTSGATSTITVAVTTEPAGGIYYALYVGDAAAGFANARFQTVFAGNTVTIETFNGAGALGVDADGSFSALAYDGFYSVQSDPNQTGYFKRVNGALSTVNPGTEFDTALTAMWAANGADPEEIWMTGGLRTAFGQLTRIGPDSAASGYRTNVRIGDNSMTMGAAVTGYVNPATGSMVDVNSHPFALPGSALIRSRSLPVPDSNVPAPAVKVNVQDYMGIQWPVIQMSWDISSYQFGTLVHYAPGWSGLLVGFTNENAT